MNNFIVIYLGSSYVAEEEALIKHGIKTIRLESVYSVSSMRHVLDNKIWRGILRAKGISLSDYGEVYNSLSKANVNLINDVKQKDLHGSFCDYYPIIERFSPKSVIFNRYQTVHNVIAGILENKLSLPVFLRSEKESAAKYVGLEGCMVPELNSEIVGNRISNLDENVKGYTTLIFKEVVNIKKNHLGTKLEYRAIVMDGVIVFFDYDENSLPTPEACNILAETEIIIKNIFENGFKGAFFMDFAITDDDKVVIVESKDIVDGSIHNIEGFSQALVSNINNLSD